MDEGGGLLAPGREGRSTELRGALPGGVLSGAALPGGVLPGGVLRGGASDEATAGLGGSGAAPGCTPRAYHRPTPSAPAAVSGKALTAFPEAARIPRRNAPVVTLDARRHALQGPRARGGERVSRYQLVRDPSGNPEVERLYRALAHALGKRR